MNLCTLTQRRSPSSLMRMTMPSSSMPLLARKKAQGWPTCILNPEGVRLDHRRCAHPEHRSEVAGFRVPQPPDHFALQRMSGSPAAKLKLIRDSSSFGGCTRGISEVSGSTNGAEAEDLAGLVLFLVVLGVLL